MMKKIVWVLLMIAFGELITGCSTVTSSLEYSLGTQCLERCDYQGAIVQLERAVQLDPELSRNYTNLAAAYCGCGDINSAWYYSRKSVLCKYIDDVALIGFMQLSKALIAGQGLDKQGTSLDEILTKLGDPDSFEEDENGHFQLSYGLMRMHFFEEKLTACSFAQ